MKADRDRLRNALSRIENSHNSISLSDRVGESLNETSGNGLEEINWAHETSNSSLNMFSAHKSKRFHYK